MACVPTGYPEPVHRIRTKPTASRISLREAPAATLDAMLRTCDHYERLCAGYYEPQTRASRYVYDLSKEIKGMVGELNEKYGDEKREIEERIAYLERIMSDWNHCFGNDRSVTPSTLLEKFNKNVREFQKVSAQLKDAEDRACRQKEEYEKRFHEVSSNYRYSLEKITEQYEKQLQSRKQKEKNAAAAFEAARSTRLSEVHDASEAVIQETMEDVAGVLSRIVLGPSSRQNPQLREQVDSVLQPLMKGLVQLQAMLLDRTPT
eukprot:ANDGO_02159.mRNA.1 hypothetical protein AMSG_04383